MKIASTISRYLLGFIFLVFGLNGFYTSSPCLFRRELQVNSLALSMSHAIWPFSSPPARTGYPLVINRYVRLPLPCSEP